MGWCSRPCIAGGRPCVGGGVHLPIVLVGASTCEIPVLSGANMVLAVHGASDEVGLRGEGSQEMGTTQKGSDEMGDRPGAHVVECRGGHEKSREEAVFGPRTK